MIGSHHLHGQNDLLNLDAESLWMLTSPAHLYFSVSAKRKVDYDENESTAVKAEKCTSSTKADNKKIDVHSHNNLAFLHCKNVQQ